jgi:hypothetical protein
MQMEETMRKTIALLAVGICALIPATSLAEQGWSATPQQKSLSWQQFRAHLDDAELVANLDKPSVKAVKTGRGIDVVELGVPAGIVEVPSATSAALKTLDEAVESFRNAIAGNPAVVKRLEERGYGINDVLAATRHADGSVTVFVGSSA